MLAETCDQSQAERLVEHVRNPDAFGGLVPFPTVSRDDADFHNEGRYWCGGGWLPTTYMATKALERYGYQEEADETAEQLLAHMFKTYREYQLATIWECYSPTEAKPSTNEHGKIARPDFCGWSALGPISLFIENVLGFHTIDAFKNEIHWRKHQKGLHGIRNVKVSTTTTHILGNKNSISVWASAPYTLLVNGKRFEIKNGINHFGDNPQKLNH